jgi:hypothetical protein
MAAQGEIVAITEDHCIPAPDWFRSLVRAHAAHPGTAIGGSVDNGAVDRHVDRAVFFCEYSNFLSPVDSGVVHDLPGPNVSYKRAALLGVPDALTDGYWETFLHARLEQDGDALWSDPALKVVHKKHFQSQEFLWERYHYGRAYAGRRNEHMGPPRRLVYLAGSFLLPPVLLGRIARRVWGRRQHRRMFTLSLPLLLLFLSAGAVGEFVGTLAGPGDSAKRLS